MSELALAKLLNTSYVPEILEILKNEPQHIEGLQRKIGAPLPTIVDRVNLLILKGLIKEEKITRREKTLQLTDYGRRVKAGLDEAFAKIKLMVEKAQRERLEQD